MCFESVFFDEYDLNPFIIFIDDCSILLRQFLHDFHDLYLMSCFGEFDYEIMMDQREEFFNEFGLLL